MIAFLRHLLLLIFFLPKIAFSFEKLPEKYTVSVGPSGAEIEIVEYFSLGCPLCLKLIKTEFESVYKEHCIPKKIRWTFHPDPQDITTLQLMICLEKLPPEKKWQFFWEIVHAVKLSSQGRSTFLMQELMKRFGREIPLLHDIKWIETTDAYREAFNYLKQEGIPEEIPAITKNNVLFKGIPTKNFIKEMLLCH